MYILTSPFAKTFDTQGLLYFVPDFLVGSIKTGIIVEVPIGKKTENAIVLNIIESLDIYCRENNVLITEDKIKSITGIVTERSFISDKNIILSQFISEYYFCAIHHSINLFFPNIIRKKILGVNEKFFKNMELTTQEHPHKYSLNNLSSEQEDVYKKLTNNIVGGGPINLLYGITGSGKTEIYMHLIRDTLLKNKQALLLIPEIILNNQIGDKITKAFGENVIIMNSSITDGNKAQFFGDIHSGRAQVIVGTRSSLFYPFRDLGLIIMDEEHDKSYNSDKSPRYKSKEVIEKMGELHPGIGIVLGSGTPSISSMYKAVKKEWNLVTLLEKYNNK